MTQVPAKAEDQVEGTDGFEHPIESSDASFLKPFPVLVSRPSAPTTVVVGIGRISLLIVGWHLALAAAFYAGLKML
jgi:hypothetical protein